MSDLSSVDVVNGDVVFSEVALYVVGQVLSQLITFPNGVQQESTIIAETTEHVIHMEISLYVACYEVRCLNLVS